MNSTTRKITGLIAAVLFLLCSCSNSAERTPNPTGLSGEVLFERLLVFQEEVGGPTSEYYAGISFSGYEAFLGNLTIYVVGEENVQNARTSLTTVFGQEGENISISVWDSLSTVADEELKRRFTREVDWGDNVVFADYHEITDRLVIALNSVDAVTRYEESTLSQLEIPREALSIHLSRPVSRGDS